MFRATKVTMYLIEKKEDLYMDIKTVVDTKETKLTTLVYTLILTVVEYIDLLVLKKIQNSPLLNSKAYFLS